MKNLKRISLFALGIIAVAKYAVNYRQNKKEKEEHQFILNLLKSNKDIEKLMELEEIKRLGVKFKKHPKSKNDNTKSGDWEVKTDNTITIPVYGNLINSPDKDMRLFYLAHELGHLSNKRGFKHYRPCNHEFKSCLLVEMETDLYAAGLLKKIGVELNGYLWSRNFGVVRNQCKNCLEIIGKGGCPADMITKINEYLNIIDQVSKLESRRIIFGEEKA